MMLCLDLFMASWLEDLATRQPPEPTNRTKKNMSHLWCKEAIKELNVRK